MIYIHYLVDKNQENWIKASETKRNEQKCSIRYAKMITSSMCECHINYHTQRLPSKGVRENEEVIFRFLFMIFPLFSDSRPFNNCFYEKYNDKQSATAYSLYSRSHLIISQIEFTEEMKKKYSKTSKKKTTNKWKAKRKQPKRSIPR